MPLAGNSNVNFNTEGFPKWMNFVCPSCALSYGVKALISIIKKRNAKDGGTKTELTN